MLWFTGKLRASVKANNLHLKCINFEYDVASNKISDKAPSEMPNPGYFVPRNRFLPVNVI